MESLTLGPMSAYADPFTTAELGFEIPRMDSEEVVLGNLIRHGFMTRTDVVVKEKIHGLETLNFSSLPRETIVNNIVNATVSIPEDTYIDKYIILLGDPVSVAQSKDLIKTDFVQFSIINSVDPYVAHEDDKELSTDDLTVIYAPFSGKATVIDPRVIFPTPVYLGRLGKGIGIGLALTLGKPEGTEHVLNRKFRTPQYTYDESAFKFSVSAACTSPVSFRDTVDEIVSDTKEELFRLVSYINKNKNEIPIFYGTNDMQTVNLLVETSTRMGHDVGVARVVSPILSANEKYSLRIVFPSLEKQHEFVHDVDKIVAAIEARLSGLLRSSVRNMLPALRGFEHFMCPVIGKGTDIIKSSNMSLEDYLEHAKDVETCIESKRTELDKIGEISGFSQIEEFVRRVPKSAIRKFRDEAGIRHLSNAGVKIAELVSVFRPMFDRGIGETFLVGELPGSFVSSLIRIYKSKFKWTAQSLIGGTALEDSYKLVEKFPKQWDFGPKTYGGDITNEKLKKYYVKNYGGQIGLFISDIGADGHDRQKINAPLFAASADLAIRMLKPGGSCVLKTFGLTLPTMVSVMTDMMQNFEDVYVVKTAASTPFNLEVYVIGDKLRKTPRKTEDIDYSALLYAVKANALGVVLGLNRLLAYTRTYVDYSLGSIPKNRVSKTVKYLETLF